MLGKTSVAFVASCLFPLAAHAAAIEYKTAGDCDGFPAVELLEIVSPEPASAG